MVTSSRENFDTSSVLFGEEDGSDVTDRLRFNRRRGPTELPRDDFVGFPSEVVVDGLVQHCTALRFHLANSVPQLLLSLTVDSFNISRGLTTAVSLIHSRFR